MAQIEMVFHTEDTKGSSQTQTDVQQDQTVPGGPPSTAPPSTVMATHGRYST